MAFGIGVKLHSDICVACGQPIDFQRCKIHSISPWCIQCCLFVGSVLYKEGDRKQQINIHHYTETGDYLRPFQAVTILA